VNDPDPVRSELLGAKNQHGSVAVEDTTMVPALAASRKAPEEHK